MASVKKEKHDRLPTFLRQWRKFKELTQEEAAERVGVTQATLTRIERGVIPYNQDFLERLALAYGCDPEDLLSIDPLKPGPPRLIYDPLKPGPPRLIYDPLKLAPKDEQDRAIAIIDALLKAG